MFNIQNLDVTLIGQETKERITWVTPESGKTQFEFSLCETFETRVAFSILLLRAVLFRDYTLLKCRKGGYIVVVTAYLLRAKTARYNLYSAEEKYM